MGKVFFCQECADAGAERYIHSIEARALIRDCGEVHYTCQGCGNRVKLIDEPCDHEWEAVSSSQADGGMEHIYVKCKCGKTREGRRVTWWIDD